MFLLGFIWFSCATQTEGVDEKSEVLPAQVRSLIGEWRVVSADRKALEKLTLEEDFTYVLTAGMSTESGRWKLHGMQYLDLGQRMFRFYFSGKRLVLEHEKGERYEMVSLRSDEEEVGAQNPDDPLSMFVRRIHKDKSGSFWFGTNGDGVVRFDGTLRYFSVDEGFGGHAVRGIVEDKQGVLWFGTSGGITKYDGKSFTNYSSRDGLVHDDVWSLMMADDGVLWIGTYLGLSRFDGSVFSNFELPESEPDSTRGVTSARIVHSIMQDSKGDIWFGTNGGAYIYNGETLENLSEEDGLCNNAVNSILEDDHGNYWFATHHAGVCVWDGDQFVKMDESHGVEGTEVWSLYKERDGDIWFPVENFGMYRYNTSSGNKFEFTNIYKKDGLPTNAIQCTFEDEEGNIWFGGYQGLFKYNGNEVYPVTKGGPWD